MIRSKKCLVTGGSGFVGTHLIKRLLDSNNQVISIDIADPNEEIKSNIDFRKIDIRDFDNVKKACKDVDYVFNNVALVPISKADKIFDEVNAGGTKNVLQASLDNNVKSVVHLSSSAVYKIPRKGDIITEDYPIEPVSSYGRAKYRAEEICFEYMKKGLSVSVIRARTILGKDRLGIYSILFDWILNNKKIYILGDGSNKFSYVSRSDLVDAMVLSAEKGSGEVLNISTEEYGTYRGDLEDLIKYAGSKSKIIPINATFCRTILRILDKLNLSPLAEWHYATVDKEYAFDINKAKGILGWKPKDSNQKMFRESYDWFKENYNFLVKTGTTHTTKLNRKIFWIIEKL